MPLSDDNVNVHIGTSADTKGVKDTEKALTDLEKQSGQTTESFKKMSLAVAAGEAAYSIAKQAIHDVVSFLGSTVKAAEDSENQMSQLNAVLTSTKGAAGVSAAAAIDLSKALQQTTAFSREQVLSTENMLLTFTALKRDAFPGATQAALDLAVALNHGVTPSGEQAADTMKMIGKALQDPDAGLGALHRYGVNVEELKVKFKDITDVAEKQKLIIQEIGTEFGGSAAAAAQTYAGKLQSLKNNFKEVQIEVGKMVEAVGSPVVSALTGFITAHRGMIEAMLLGGAAAATAAGGMYLLVTAIGAFNLESIIMVATNPLVWLLTLIAVLAGVTVYNAVGKMQESMSKFDKTAKDVGGTMSNDVSNGLSKAGKAMDKLGEQLEKIDAQAAKATRDFQEQMALMVQNHQDKVTSLSEQLADEKKNFDDSNNKRTETFNSSQNDMVIAHQKKVEKIIKQLDQELALGKLASYSKVTALRQQLADENVLMQDNTVDKKKKLDEETEAAKKAYDEKQSDLQKQLDKEKTFLQKHADDVASIRSVTLLDEIDKLKRSHEEQLKAFASQKNDAIKNAKETAGGVGGVWDNANASLANKFSGLGNTMGSEMGNAMKKALMNSFSDMGKGISDFIIQAGTFVGNKVKDFVLPGSKESAKSISQQWADSGAWKMRATGGPVNAGGAYAVGDNPDGSWNNTTELFVPQQSGTIIPADKARGMLGGGAGGGGTTINQTNHVYNQYDMTKANIELGWRLAVR